MCTVESRGSVTIMLILRLLRRSPCYNKTTYFAFHSVFCADVRIIFGFQFPTIAYRDVDFRANLHPPCLFRFKRLNRTFRHGTGTNLHICLISDCVALFPAEYIFKVSRRTYVRRRSDIDFHNNDKLPDFER